MSRNVTVLILLIGGYCVVNGDYIVVVTGSGDYVTIDCNALTHLLACLPAVNVSL